MEQDKVCEKGWPRPEEWEERSPSCSLLCLITLLLPFINCWSIHLFNKNDLHESKRTDVLRLPRSFDWLLTGTLDSSEIGQSSSVTGLKLQLLQGWSQGAVQQTKT